MTNNTLPVGGKKGSVAIRLLVRNAMRLYLLCTKAATLGGRRLPDEPADERYRFLLTLTFHADNWAFAHLRPLAGSRFCRHVTIVATTPLPPIDNVTVVMPPGWLMKAVGRVPARLLTFIWLAVRDRPDYVGGFHLLFNGLLAALVARVIGARSCYFCVGGPAEVLGGGIWSENKLFERLGTPDAIVERQLIAALHNLDLVITMGPAAKQALRDWGVRSRISVIPGGIDASAFRPADERDIDVILVARLAPIKRVDLFLRALRVVADGFPNLNAVVVGDGQLRGTLEALTTTLHLERNVSFVGHQSDVAAWLSRSRVFMLTSDSEGLALSLMEAMTCGAVPVVSAVGELASLVHDQLNGYVIAERRAEAFATPVLGLLTNPARRARMSEAAAQTSAGYELHAASKLWDSLLDRRPSDEKIKNLQAVASV